ncbi:uncharacterized protein BX663DRAFT_520205 [Cokeromyces recurvatus]|uniref:uncharacterized protein n=1 Tax=Cokeromyces recurvatus TaxID=90255 RepID=UPI00221F2304|nr:uncharacterized protein BX663DRAFT_520205 [Cokeromyces recurvatus]KAI7899722.1 hypothetical protein BX663DRAFT_520205 [Cokeromyces recurvatus]
MDSDISKAVDTSTYKSPIKSIERSLALAFPIFYAKVESSMKDISSSTITPLLRNKRRRRLIINSDNKRKKKKREVNKHYRWLQTNVSAENIIKKIKVTDQEGKYENMIKRKKNLSRFIFLFTLVKEMPMMKDNEFYCSICDIQFEYHGSFTRHLRYTHKLKKLSSDIKKEINATNENLPESSWDDHSLNTQHQKRAFIGSLLHKRSKSLLNEYNFLSNDESKKDKKISNDDVSFDNESVSTEELLSLFSDSESISTEELLSLFSDQDDDDDESMKNTHHYHSCLKSEDNNNNSFKYENV